MNSYNLASALPTMAARDPYRAAVIFPAGRQEPWGRFIQLSFAQLNRLTDRYAHGLSARGIHRGNRVLVLIRPGVDLIAVVFALFKIGAVPVLIDPGMGLKPFLQCVAETEPVALVGIPVAHVLRRLFPRAFRGVRVGIWVGNWGPRSQRLKVLPDGGGEPFPVAETRLDDEGAVAFTSGSTGIPKGVVYLQGMFQAQMGILREQLDMREGDSHLAAVYIFALYNPTLGITTVFPDMNPARTASLNPARLVEAIDTFGITLSMGSPTVWRRLCDYAEAHQLSFPTLRTIHMFGAPCEPELVARCSHLFPQATVYTPFGATEALPLTIMDHHEILSDTAPRTQEGLGACVGRALPGVNLQIIPIQDEPIAHWQDTLALPVGEIGEIAVKGAMVTREYLHRPQQTRAAKIQDHDAIWHRMGDLGYLDEQGRLWFCGRKSHRIETPEGLRLSALESIFNQHPEVFRSALVGVGEPGQQTPVLIIECPGKGLPNEADQARLRGELHQLAQQREATRCIKTILFHRGFPMDVRHNAKIQREKLARWATETLRS